MGQLLVLPWIITVKLILNVNGPAQQQTRKKSPPHVVIIVRSINDINLSVYNVNKEEKN